MGFDGSAGNEFWGGSGVDTINNSHAFNGFIDLSNEIAGQFTVDSVEVLIPSFADARVIGSERGETIMTTSGTFGSTLNGGGGDDSIFATSRTDTLLGGDGNDALDGGVGSDLLYGGSANDILYGGESDFLPFGMKGADTVFGGTGNDSVNGYEGSDSLFGDDGDDFVHGGEGSLDILYGGSGNDFLIGETGDDIQYGGAANDTLIGDSGNDVQYGGTGADYFVANDNTDLDTIADFEHGIDLIDITVAVSFMQLTIVASGTDAFVTWGTPGAGLLIIGHAPDALTEADFDFN